MRKRVQTRFVKFKNVCECLFIDYKASWFTNLARYRNDEDCRHSRNIPANQNDPGLVFCVTMKGPVHFGSSFPEASVSGIRSSTKSTASIYLCFTFLSFQALVSFYYDCRFSTTFIRSGSNKSLDSASVGLYIAPALVLAPPLQEIWTWHFGFVINICFFIIEDLLWCFDDKNNVIEDASLNTFCNVLIKKHHKW
jgi:hypothetical protein